MSAFMNETAMNETAINITVKTGPWASKYFAGSKALSLHADATVMDAILAVNIPEDLVGFAVIDGKAQPKEALLAPGMEVELYPMIVGG